MTEVSHDEMYYVAHNKSYDQVGSCLLCSVPLITARFGKDCIVCCLSLYGIRVHL